MKSNIGLVCKTCKPTPPTKEDILNLKVGDFIKALAGNERFWVKITKIDNDEVQGIVDNDLMLTSEHGYKLGDIVGLAFDEILQIEKSD